MHAARIVIAGAGLSGLYAAYLLERRGITDYVVLEARDVLGGRIASINGSGQAIAHAESHTGDLDRFDLGPTWFWPDFQPELDHLIQSLGLQRFEQFETGDMLVERSPQEPAMRMRGYMSSPASRRLVGGMGALIEALLRHLNPERIITGQTVSRLSKAECHVAVECRNTAGEVTTWRAEQVLLALPPRLIEATLRFDPALPPTLAQRWRTTATWMAPHAKYLAVYDKAFWREQGLSGDARSALGPLGEIHDASMPGGSAALFGFFSAPARVRSKVSDEALRAHCRAQLTRLFGAQAATPRAEYIKDWAQDPLTATTADRDAASQYQAAPPVFAESGPWRGSLIGIASECSPQFPGYLAGAVEAARLGVQALTPLTVLPRDPSKARQSTRDEASRNAAHENYLPCHAGCPAGHS